MRGLLIKSTGSTLIVQLETGEQRECHVKGNFRIKGIRTTNPVAVGDWVNVETQGDGTNWITAIEPRRNYIIRRSTNLSKEAHILAANIDQVLLMATINHPVTSLTFIDRFLATAEAYRVPVVVIINKKDLMTEQEFYTAQQWEKLYSSLGYTAHIVSVHVQEDVKYIQSLLQGKTTLISGNSGVGKSTLLNAIFGETKTRTGLISTSHDKGMHTTTFSEMYALPSTNSPASWIIDTPGVKGFGSVEIDKYEVSHYFRELFQIGHNCRYGDCLHINEPGCEVLRAVEDGRIALSRYESYLSLIGDAQEGKYR